MADDLVRSVLSLNDLHPASVESRIARRLETVRPYLNSHGGGVELVATSAAGIQLKMQGSCKGCPSSSATQRDRIEQAIRELAPDVGLIEFVEAPQTAADASFVELKPRYIGDPPAMANLLET